MTSNLAPGAGRAVPGGALFALTIGLLLYLTTSLVLGSTNGSRVFDVSLSLPGIEAAPEAQANLSADRITGSRLVPAASAARLIQAPTIGVPMVVARTTISATTPTAPSTALPGKPTIVPAKARVGASKRAHYHDADERSHRLARRR